MQAVVLDVVAVLVDAFALWCGRDGMTNAASHHQMESTSTIEAPQYVSIIVMVCIFIYSTIIL